MPDRQSSHQQASEKETEYCSVCGVDTAAEKPVHAFGCSAATIGERTTLTPGSLDPETHVQNSDYACKECNAVIDWNWHKNAEVGHRGWCSKRVRVYDHPPVAIKYDDGKPVLSLLPPGALLQISEVLRYGAKKYGDRNWEQGMARSRMLDALLRHLLAYMTGEDLDKESNLPHLAHAGCCLLFLIEYTILGIGEDTRTKMYADRNRQNKTNTGTDQSMVGRTGGISKPISGEDSERKNGGSQADS